MNVLALVESPDHVCARYRVKAFRPALESAGARLTVESLAASALARAAQLRAATRFDIVLLQRKLLPGWQLALLRRAARRLVFDFDDAVVYRDSFDPRGPHCPRRRRRFTALMRSVDAVLAGNAFLQALAGEHGLPQGRSTVIPTCVDTRRYETRPTSTRQGFRLVWVGSSSTLKGLESSAPLWRRVGREVPGARLRLVCDRFARFDPLPVEEVRWSEATEADALASADVGVAWLPDDPWSRGKCGLKLLQYMAAGLPVVANPVGVQASMVVHGQSGLLAIDEDSWIDALRLLAADPARRAALGRNARADVERRFDVRVWEDRFVQALLGSAPLVRSPHTDLREARATTRAGGLS